MLFCYGMSVFLLGNLCVLIGSFDLQVPITGLVPKFITSLVKENSIKSQHLNYEAYSKKWTKEQI